MRNLTLIILLSMTISFSLYITNKRIAENRAVITQQTETIKLLSDEIINLKNK